MGGEDTVLCLLVCWWHTHILVKKWKCCRVKLRSQAGRDKKHQKQSVQDKNAAALPPVALKWPLMSWLLTIIVACLYKFKFGCSEAGSCICQDFASVGILPSWTLLLFSAPASTSYSRFPPPLSQQQRMAGQAAWPHLRSSHSFPHLWTIWSSPSLCSFFI